jgi:hypothetical protein
MRSLLMGELSHNEEKMAKHYHQLLVLILVTTFIAACGSAPTPTPSPMPTPVPPTPTALPATPTNSPPTVTPTAVPPTPTALSPTATNPSPTTVPSTEEVETEPNHDNSNVMEANSMNIKIGDNVLTATLVENSSVDALKEALSEGPITVNMRDYGTMEKVGSLGMDLPRNDKQITTEAGDIILFQGSALVIYYAPNSWNFTRLGKINNVTTEELREILGDGNVTITLSLPQE